MLKNKSLLVTGGAGFIGSEFVRQAIKRGYKVTVVDALTYAGDLKRLSEVKGRYTFFKSNISNKSAMRNIFKKVWPDAVIHMAAETHVDRSIKDAGPFIDTNVKGTQVLLDCSREIGLKRFIHISTDEVYGEIDRGKFKETSPFAPNSPYSASKAAADMLVQAYWRTYGLPTLIVRPSNNYGPWQYPEKFIPVAVMNLLMGKKIPVYGKGINVREWLYVSDCADGIFCVLEKGIAGQAYNLGSGQQIRNIDLAQNIVRLMGKTGKDITFVKDRPGHDIRYALDTSKITKELGWRPTVDFADGLSRTIAWYKSQKTWNRPF
jgi:dTDP-glucose 4,6-dehydratase